MTMKKILISILFVAAAFSARAQMTPDAIMALLPNMPSQTEMVRYARESCAHASQNIEVTQPSLYDDFREALKQAQEQASASVEGNTTASFTSKAMKSKVAGTGYTGSELTHMSEAQREQVARAQANSTLSGLGLSQAEIAKLQSGNVTEAEAQALAAKMVAAQTGGMTMADVQALQGMTKEQQQKYLEESGLQESMSAKAKADKSKTNKNSKVATLEADLARLTRQHLELDSRIEKVLTDAIKKGQDMYNDGYKNKIAQWEKARSEAMREGAGAETYTDAEKSSVEAAARKLKNAEYQQWLLRCEFYEKYIPLWRNAIVQQMDMVRSQEMPLMTKMKTVTNELYQLTKDEKYAIGDSYPYNAALKYLEIPEGIGDYNGPIGL